MGTGTRGRGRPREFDPDDVLERSIEVFWHRGFTGTTTRTLEQSLGVSQSSLYNSFGSKEQLFEQALDRYQEQLDATVLAHLHPPSRQAIIEFLTAVEAWVSDDDHRGCLVLNLAAESSTGEAKAGAYRQRLRSLLTPAIATFTDDHDLTGARTELVVAAVLGLNIAARSGAPADELRRLGDGIRRQITAW